MLNMDKYGNLDEKWWTDELMVDSIPTFPNIAA